MEIETEAVTVTKTEMEMEDGGTYNGDVMGEPPSLTGGGSGNGDGGGSFTS